MKRLRSRKPDKVGGSYFAAPSANISFISTGCTGLDLALGGGWPLGRMSNIVGDKSTGKTLLAIEAAANFVIQYPKGRIWYREAEAAFDRGYAAALGMPISRVDFGKKRFDTVEDIFEDLAKKILICKEQNIPGLYIVDSLDALSDRAEMKRGLDEGSYNLSKQKKLGELFRKQVREIENAQICLLIISQVRDKIGITFGRKTTRSGGKAMDFYASLVVYLSHIKTLSKTVKGQKRPTGIRVRAKCDKNKISLPFREFDFAVRFGYGVEDLQSNLEWLEQVGRLPEVGLKKGEVTATLTSADRMSSDEFTDLCATVGEVVRKAWSEIETSFLPKRRKY